MTRKSLSPPRAVTDAAVVLGQQVRIHRTRRRMPIRVLAQRAGVSPRTVSLVEHGDPSVSIGNVFSVAYQAGVPLFGAENASELTALRRVGKDMLALMPTRAVPPDFGELRRG